MGHARKGAGGRPSLLTGLLWPKVHRTLGAKRLGVLTDGIFPSGEAS